MQTFLGTVQFVPKSPTLFAFDFGAHLPTLAQEQRGQKRLQSSQLAGFEYAPEILGKLQTDWAKLNNGWTLEPTAKILHIGTAVLLPDAVWRDAGGREIFLEVLGFWTPDGLAERLAEFARCGFANFILLASDELRGSRDAPDNPPPQLFTYKTTPSAKSLALVVSSLAI